MIIGIKNVSSSHPLKGLIIKRFLLLYGLLVCSSIFSQQIDTLDIKLPAFSFTPKVFHHPSRVLLNSRIFEFCPPENGP